MRRKGERGGDVERRFCSALNRSGGGSFRYVSPSCIPPPFFLLDCVSLYSTGTRASPRSSFPLSSIVPAISKPCTAPFLHALFPPRESQSPRWPRYDFVSVEKKIGRSKAIDHVRSHPICFPTRERERVNRFLRKEEEEAFGGLRCACGESVAAYEDQGIKGVVRGWRRNERRGRLESCKWDERGRQLEREIEREEGKDKRGGREL